MRFENEKELEASLFDHWLDLRYAGRLDEVLPSCSNRVWESSGDQHGYQTVDHRIHRRVSVADANPEGGPAIAPLIETYWSVRMLNSKQSNEHGPNLHLNRVKIPHLQANKGLIGTDPSRR